MNDPCYKTPFNGNINLATPPMNQLFAISVMQGIPYRKGGITSYRDVAYMNERYGSPFPPPKCNPTLAMDMCDTSTASLVYDVYYPTRSTTSYAHYDDCPLPAVILFHAGGFSDCSNY